MRYEYSSSSNFTSTCIGASFGSVTPKAEFEKFAIGDNFLKEAKAAAVQVRCPAGGIGESNELKRMNKEQLIIINEQVIMN